jgi:hypothetical protein
MAKALEYHTVFIAMLLVTLYPITNNGCDNGCPSEDKIITGDDDSHAFDDDSCTDDDDDSANGGEIDFIEVSSGESEGDGIGDSSTCNELNLTLLESQDELDTIYQNELYGVYVNEGAPLGIDFNNQIGVLSYTTYCPHLGFRLVVDRVQITNENEIVLEETLWHPDGYLSVDGRTYNLIAVESGSYETIMGVLNEEYEE